jgi:hypothetical protein
MRMRSLIAVGWEWNGEEQEIAVDKTGIFGRMNSIKKEK